jgi:hypothetical protein
MTSRTCCDIRMMGILWVFINRYFPALLEFWEDRVVQSMHCVRAMRFHECILSHITPTGTFPYFFLRKAKAKASRVYAQASLPSFLKLRMMLADGMEVRSVANLL